MNIKTLVFDFDGTIVDSNELKEKAYLELFPSVSPKAKKIIEQVSSGSRKTRYQIIREILVALKDAGEIEVGDAEEEIKKLAKKWGEIVDAGITGGKGLPGAFETLWFFYNNGYGLYILSGTPLEPLRRVAGKLIESGKIPPFKNIFGRIDDNDEKTFKKEILTEIIKQEDVSAESIAVVGDGDSECEAALEAGCFFAGIANKFNGWSAKEAHFVVIDNWAELPALLDGRGKQ